jgi:hypothetical protein
MRPEESGVRSPIARDDAELLLRVLHYAPDSEARGQFAGALAQLQRASATPVRWCDIRPPDAALLWQEVVWLRHWFSADEQALLDRIVSRLAALKESSSTTSAG